MAIRPPWCVPRNHESASISHRFQCRNSPRRSIMPSLGHRCFTVTLWRLCETPSIPDSVSFQGEQRETQQKIENLLEAISCSKTTARDRGRSVKRNGVQLDCPSAAHLTSLGGRHNQVQFQIWGHVWIPQPKLRRACYLIFFIKSQNGLVWPF